MNQSFNTGAIGYSNQELFSQRGAGLVGEASTGDISHCLNAGGMGRQDYETETLVTHALRARGSMRSVKMARRRGTPLVPVAFSAKDHGADATEDLPPTLRAMPHDTSHANGGGQMAVAVPLLEVGKRTGPSSRPMTDRARRLASAMMATPCTRFRPVHSTVSRPMPFSQGSLATIGVGTGAACSTALYHVG